MQSIQNQNKIKLADEFSYGRLARFTFPSIIIMIFSAFYGIVDGYFISNHVGETAFASVTLIIPFVQIISCMGVVLGADGGALIARTLGIGNREKAGRYFTMTMFATLIGGILFTAIGLITLRPAAHYLGATQEMLQDCLTYGKICILFSGAQLAQTILLNYLVIAEKPKLATRVVILSFLLNVILDIVFVDERFLNMGVMGAAIATGISQTVSVSILLLWFASKSNRTALRFRKTRIEYSVLRKAGYTGSAEAISIVAASVIGLLYNSQLMKYSGADAVKAYGVELYVSFVFTNIYNGYSNGASPILGYKFSSGRKREMRNVFKMSIVIMATVTMALLAAVVIFARPISEIFVGYDSELVGLTVTTLTICVMPYLVMWLNVYLSSVFSALGMGLVSAILTFIRVLVLPVICIISLPTILPLDPAWYTSVGVWYALTGAEILSAIVALIILSTQKKKFNL